MRFEQLECLLQIAETGSFTEAAKKLYLTQQAVSMNIKQLERELEETLIIRENTNIHFTARGEQVLASAKVIVEEKNNIMASATCMCQENVVQHISIGSTSCLANLVLPRIIKKQSHKKKIRLDLVASESVAQVLSQIQNKEKDMGLILYNAEEFEKLCERYQDNLIIEVLARDEIISVINKKDYDGISESWVREPIDSSFLLAVYNVEAIEQWKTEIQRYDVISSNDAEFIRSLLDEAGAWVTMTALSQQILFNSKKYISLSIKDLDAQIVHAAVYRKDTEPFLKEFVRMIRQEMHVK